MTILFSGGGVKDSEDILDALKRELKEELGARDILVNDYIGYTVEYRYGINGSNSIYKQVSHYYLCDINEFGLPNYVGRELEQGLEAKWVDIDLVINHNLTINTTRVNDKGYSTVLIRENQVLNHLKEFVK